jgi:hypothetical protein
MTRVVVADVDAEDGLAAEFGDRVPVVLGPSGDVLAEGVITAWRAFAAIGALRRR